MRKLFSFLIIGTALALTLTGCETKEVNANQEEVVVEDATGIAVYGKVEADNIEEIYINFPATAEQINVKEGQEVKAGDVILTFDNEAYKNEISRKKSEIELLKVELGGIYNTLDTNGIKMDQTQSELDIKNKQLEAGTDPDIVLLEQKKELAENKLNLARKEYADKKEILAVGGISNSEIEDVELTIKELEKEIQEVDENIKKTKTSKQLEIDELKAAVSTLRTQMSNTDNENQTNINSLKLKIEIAECELSDMEAKLKKAYLKDNNIIATQESGVIYEVQAKVGTPLDVASEKGAILKIINQESLIVTVNVPETFISQVALGDRVDVSLYANDEEVIQGKVRNIANNTTLINGENMVKVDVEIENNQSSLKYGYEVDATIYR